MRADYVLGIDYGARRVGLALAQEIARLPRPLTTLHNDESLMDRIEEIVRTEHICQIVVGVPRDMDGSATAQSGLCEAFAQQLALRVTVPVQTADETLSSVEAEQYLSGGAQRYTKEEVDAVAAAVILERYFTEDTTSRTEEFGQ